MGDGAGAGTRPGAGWRGGGRGGPGAGTGPGAGAGPGTGPFRKSPGKWIGAGAAAGDFDAKAAHSAGVWSIPLQKRMTFSEIIVSLPNRLCKSCKAPKLLDGGKNCGKPVEGLSCCTAR